MKKKIVAVAATLALALGFLGGAFALPIGSARADGGSESGAAASTKPVVTDFFEATSGTLTATDSVSGVTLTATGTGESVSLKYKDKLPASGLSEIVKMRILPETAGNVDFDMLQVIVRDSVDSDEVISVTLSASVVWDSVSKGTNGKVAFTDDLVCDSYNTAYTGASTNTRNVFGLDDWQNTGYTWKGAVNVGDWGNYYPILAAAEGSETQTFTVRYDGDKAIRVHNGTSDQTLAFLDGTPHSGTSTDFLTASAAVFSDDVPAEAALKERYTSEYVNGLFSSGNVTIELKFHKVKNDRVSVRLKSLCGVGFDDTVWTRNQTDSVKDISGATTSDETGAVTNLANHIVLPQTLTKTQLASGVTFQILPTQVSGAWKSSNLAQIIFRDSVNSNQVISVVTSKAADWGNIATSLCTLDDNITSVSGYGYVGIGKTKVNMVGYDHYSGGAKYNAKGYALNNYEEYKNWGLNQFETTPEINVKYDYSTKTVDISSQWGGTLATFEAVTDSSTTANNFFKASTAQFYDTDGVTLKNLEDQSIVDKYTIDWVNGLFSSNAIKVEFKFFNISGAGTPDYDSINTAASLKILSLGGTDNPQFTTKSVPTDTIAPTVTAPATVEVESGLAQQSSAIIASVTATATDNVETASNITITKKLYNASDEEQTGEVTPAAGWYVGTVATDRSGNASAVKKTNLTLVDYFDVTFKDGDGTTMKTDHVKSGTAATAPTTTPTKTGTADKDYTFSGWDKTFTNVTEDMTVTALFTETAKQYTITFTNHDGSTITTKNVPYGTVPTYDGTTPTKAHEDSTKYYEFTGWTPTLAAVSGAATYTATFTEQNKIVVTFVNYDGTELKKDYVLPNGDATAPETNPAKPEDDSATYAFSGWDKTFTGVTENMTVTALFTPTPKSYTVRFLGEDESVIWSGSFTYGSTAEFRGESVPTKEPSGGYAYAFDGWNETLSEVTGDADYTVKFKAVPVEYTVTFVTNGADDIEVAKRTIFNEYTLPTDISRDGYEFLGWFDNQSLSGEAVVSIAAGIENEGDKTFYAKWKAVETTPDQSGSNTESNKGGCANKTARELAIAIGSLTALLGAAFLVFKK